MEKEVELVHKMNRELGSLNEKIDSNHEVHVRNAGKIDKILDQTTKTNGRVTQLESFVMEQHKINSKLNGMLEACWKMSEQQENRYSYVKGILKVLGVLGAILIVSGGYFFTLIIEDIVHKNLKETLEGYDIITE